MSGVQFPTLPKSPELQQAESGPSSVRKTLQRDERHSGRPSISLSTSPLPPASSASAVSPQSRHSMASSLSSATHDSARSSSSSDSNANPNASSASASIGFPMIARPMSRASLASSRPSSVASNSSSSSSSHVHGQLAACPSILSPGLASALGLVPAPGSSGGSAMLRKDSAGSHRRIRAQSTHGPTSSIRRPSLPTVPSMHHRMSVASVASFESLPEDEMVHGFASAAGPGCLPKTRHGSYELPATRQSIASPPNASSSAMPFPSTGSPVSSPSRLSRQLEAMCSLHTRDDSAASSVASARPGPLKRVATEPAQNAELVQLLARRGNAAMELLGSEKSFMASLQLLDEDYYQPLMASLGRGPNGAASPTLASGAPILSRKAIGEIFSNFSDILQLSKELLSRLEERLQGGTATSPNASLLSDTERNRAWDPALDTIGDILVPLAPFMKMYSLYVKNFSSALQRIEAERKSNEAFAQFLKEAEQRRQAKELSDSAATGKKAFGFGLGFQAHLLTVVQRIPRYKLLVDDLIKHTPDSHVDKPDLVRAGNTIEEVASYINENVRQHEMVLTMLSLQRSLQGLTEPLVVPGRSLLRRGTLMKTCRRNVQPREFFLFTDCIIYASPISGGIESASAAWLALAQKGGLYGGGGGADSIFGSNPTTPASPGDASAAIETVMPRARLRTISGPEAYTPLAGAIFSLAGHQLQFRGKFPLRDCTVVSVDDHAMQGLRYCFEIRTPEKSFAVYAETSSSKEAWVSAIREARAEFLSARRTLRAEEDSIEARRDKRRSHHRIDAQGASNRRLSTQSLGQYIGLTSAPTSIPEAESESADVEADSRSLAAATATAGATAARTRTESAPLAFRPPSFPSFPSNATSLATLLSASSNAIPTKPLRVLDDYNAPVWVPDNRAEKCACCSEVFGMWRRKHHCRLCGQVVCWTCSQRSFLIPAFQDGGEDRPARACDSCYDSVFPPDSPEESSGSPLPDETPEAPTLMAGSVGMVAGVSNDGSGRSASSAGLFDSDTSPGSPATPGDDASPRFAQQAGPSPLGSPPSSATLRSPLLHEKLGGARPKSLRFDTLPQSLLPSEPRESDAASLLRFSGGRSKSMVGGGAPLMPDRSSVAEAQLFQAALRPQVQAATSGSGTFRLVTPRLTTPDSEMPPNASGRRTSYGASTLGAASYFGIVDASANANANAPTSTAAAYTAGTETISGPWSSAPAGGAAVPGVFAGAEEATAGARGSEPIRPSLMHGPSGIPAHLRPQRKRPMSAADRLSTFYGANLALSSSDGKKK
ncbi:hypothetical protein ACQY0O_001372 [Thecaphora frezii]